jgi:hypothetical protein
MDCWCAACHDLRQHTPSLKLQNRAAHQGMCRQHVGAVRPFVDQNHARSSACEQHGVAAPAQRAPTTIASSVMTLPVFEKSGQSVAHQSSACPAPMNTVFDHRLTFQ